MKETVFYGFAIMNTANKMCLDNSGHFCIPRKMAKYGKIFGKADRAYAECARLRVLDFPCIVVNVLEEV